MAKDAADVTGVALTSNPDNGRTDINIVAAGGCIKTGVIAKRRVVLAIRIAK